VVAAAALAECVRHLQPLRQAARIRLLSVEVGLLVQVWPDRKEVLAHLIPHRARAVVVVGRTLAAEPMAEAEADLAHRSLREVLVQQVKATTVAIQHLASMQAAAAAERERLVSTLRLAQPQEAEEPELPGQSMGPITQAAAAAETLATPGLHLAELAAVETAQPKTLQVQRLAPSTAAAVVVVVQLAASLQQEEAESLWSHTSARSVEAAEP
jgi:hypothetical protein